VRSRARRKRGAASGRRDVERSFPSLVATHVWLSRALDLCEEMMEHCHENGVPAVHG
jgi:hypothetical protein